MAVSRLNRRATFLNSDDIFFKKFENKGVQSVNQYVSPRLIYPTQEQIQSLDIVTHTWQIGDSLWKLAEKNFGDPNYWHLIAFFNQKPTEQHFQIGDTVYIPLPLFQALNVMTVS